MNKIGAEDLSEVSCDVHYGNFTFPNAVKYRLNATSQLTYISQRYGDVNGGYTIKIRGTNFGTDMSLLIVKVDHTYQNVLSLINGELTVGIV